MADLWYWSGESEVLDIPDPVGFEGEWKLWPATMEDGPPVAAEIFAREYIQNTWDSIKKKTEIVGLDKSFRGSISFHFVRLTGKEASQFAKSLDLHHLVSRIQSMDKGIRDDNRLEETALVNGDLKTIHLLVAVENGGIGMSGKWDSGDDVNIKRSLMRTALIQSTTGNIGGSAGGSWGKGKLAIAGASKARVLAAYTCHPEQDQDDAGVTRRLMGVTYWRPHVADGRRLRGLGMIGELKQKNPSFSSFEPFTNETADQFVEELNVKNFAVRDPNIVSEHGTSYLFVDPSFTPIELAQAIERNWWPLLEGHKLNIEIYDYENSQIEVHPRNDQNIFPFIRAFDIARGIDNVKDTKDIHTNITVGSLKAGDLALISDQSEDGWSLQQTPNGNTNLVALIRNDLVIAYQPFPRRRRSQPPFIRGAFIVADGSEANGILRLTEGHLHNEWIETGTTKNPKFARTVLDQINTKVVELKRSITAIEEVSDFRFRAFQRFFSGSGNSVGPAPKNGSKGSARRDFSIQQVSQTVIDYEVDNPTRLRFRSKALIAIMPNHEKSHLTVTVDLGWGVYGESNPLRETSLTDHDSEVMPEGFSRIGDALVGVLSKTPVEFEWSSHYFPDDWQVVPDPQIRSSQGTQP